MRMKYLDKRGWKRAIQSEYKEVAVTMDSDSWIIGMLTVKKTKSPLIVDVLNEKVCVLDNGYRWMTVLPEKQNFSMTVMYDRDLNVRQYYFDINEHNVLELGEARRRDMYLDILALPDGRLELVDEDDLDNALKTGKIDKKTHSYATHVAEMLKENLQSHFKDYKNIAHACLQEVT